MKTTLGKALALIFAVGGAWFIASSGFVEDGPGSSKTEQTLSKPKKKSKVSLEEALNLRQSTKEGFSSQKLKEQEISQILWAARGVNRPSGKLTSPSATARYGVSVYIATAEGTFLYNPQSHSLLSVSEKDIRQGAGTQEYVKSAPVILIFVADFSKLSETLSYERKLSFLSAEAGAIGENVYLECAALKLGTCFVASVDKDFIKTALNFGEGVEPLFIMPVGHFK